MKVNFSTRRALIFVPIVAAVILAATAGTWLWRNSLTPHLTARDLAGEWTSLNGNESLGLQTDGHYTATGRILDAIGLKSDGGSWRIANGAHMAGVELGTGDRQTTFLEAGYSFWSLQLTACNGDPDSGDCVTLTRMGRPDDRTKIPARVDGDRGSNRGFGLNRPGFGSPL